MVFHCSLNPHPDEKLSDEILAQIAKEYMEALGYGKQPYIVFKHNDIAREHIHIVSLRINGEGKKINDKFEKRRSKKITDTLERKFGLIPSSKVTDKAMNETPKIDTSRGNIKEQVASVLRMVLKHYKFCSLGELNAILGKYNLAVEEVKTEFRGRKYDGLVYVPTDDKGDKVSSPIHASDIGRGVGYTAVQNRMQKSKQAIKPLISIIRYRVLQTMRTSLKTEEELQQRLEEQGLRVFIRKNESGRIYGITFIDDKEGIALNGSRLGKELSANAVAEWFDRPHPELSDSIQQSEKSSLSQTSNSDEDSVLGGLLDLPLEAHGTDWEEEQFRRRMQRKKRKHRKL